jgi:alcohol dehydrogenase class IV
MTAYFDVPHGQAVSITLREFLEYNYDVRNNDLTGKKTVEEIKSSIEEIVSLTGSENVKQAKEKNYEFNEEHKFENKAFRIEYKNRKRFRYNYG